MIIKKRVSNANRLFWEEKHFSLFVHCDECNFFKNIEDRLDGVFTLSSVAGTLLSPQVFEHWGYFGNYGLSTLSFVLAIFYIVFLVKEPIDTKKQKDALPANLTCNINNELNFCQGHVL